MHSPFSLGEDGRATSAQAPFTRSTPRPVRRPVSINIRALPADLDRHVWATLGSLAAAGPFETLEGLKAAFSRVSGHLDWGMPELSPMIGDPLQLAILHAALDQLRIKREAGFAAANRDFTERVIAARQRGMWCLVDEALKVQERAVETASETYALASSAAFASAVWGAKSTGGAGF